MIELSANACCQFLWPVFHTPGIITETRRNACAFVQITTRQDIKPLNNPSIHLSSHPSISQSIRLATDQPSNQSFKQTSQLTKQWIKGIYWTSDQHTYKATADAIIIKDTRFLFLSVFTPVWLHCIIIPGFHFDANLWVSNFGISNSTAAVEVGQVGNVILRKPGGGLAYADDVTNLYICEARELMQF